MIYVEMTPPPHLSDNQMSSDSFDELANELAPVGFNYKDKIERFVLYRVVCIQGTSLESKSCCVINRVLLQLQME